MVVGCEILILSAVSNKPFATVAAQAGHKYLRLHQPDIAATMVCAISKCCAIHSWSGAYKCICELFEVMEGLLIYDVHTQYAP